jgi:hypothetical protein
VLPDASTDIDDALAIAQEVVTDLLQQASSLLYEKAVYNLGVHNLIENAQDVTPTVIYKNNLPYFAYWRDTWKINTFTPGILTSTSDEGTSSSYLNPEFISKLQMSDLQYLKTPFGRAYIGYAMRAGNNWGIS